MQDEAAVNAAEWSDSGSVGSAWPRWPPDLADLLVVLVLMVDERGQQVNREEGELGRGADLPVLATQATSG